MEFMANTHKTISVEVDADLFEQINLIAEVQEKDIGVVVEDILRSHVEAQVGDATHEEFLRHSHDSFQKNRLLVELLAKS